MMTSIRYTTKEIVDFIFSQPKERALGTSTNPYTDFDVGSVIIHYARKKTHKPVTSKTLFCAATRTKEFLPASYDDYKGIQELYTLQFRKNPSTYGDLQKMLREYASE